MTTAALPPTASETPATIIPPQVASIVPAPFPVPLEGPVTLTRRCDPSDPVLTITAREPCPACDGEGTIEVDIPRGVWVPSQGGMWVPDSRRVACDECDGRNHFTRTRCLACGRIHDTDEWQFHGERLCDCDPEDVLAAIDALDSTCVVLGHVAAAERTARDLGMHTACALHGVPIEHLIALTARSGDPIGQHARTREHPAFYAADITWHDTRVSLYSEVE